MPNQNYIHRLQGQVAELQTQREEANELLTDVLVYLGSSKFWYDPTAQVRDLQTRLQPRCTHPDPSLIASQRTGINDRHILDNRRPGVLHPPDDHDQRPRQPGDIGSLACRSDAIPRLSQGRRIIAPGHGAQTLPNRLTTGGHHHGINSPRVQLFHPCH